MKRQTTLGKYGFTKKVKRRENQVEVKIPDYANVDHYRIKCDFCDSKFINEQGYSVHLKCKHGR